MKEEIEKEKMKVKIKNIIWNTIYKKNKVIFIFIFFGALVIIGSIGIFMVSGNKKQKVEVIATSTLQKIISVNELSTFQVVYNGIAEVLNQRDIDKVDYYVSYMSRVNAGIDFGQVKIDVNHDNKIITATIPEIKIMDINVDITSLDYFFYNKKANNETVSQEAYKSCLEDVKKEVSEKEDIYELAEENAKNILKALISPFVEQLDSNYILEIN